jgi:hypothetical protein
VRVRRHGSAVSVRTTSMWALRVRREAPRYALGTLAALGLASSVRWTVAPPAPAAATAPAAPAGDPASQAYAVLFVRRYLTWRAADPSQAANALAPFLGTTLEPSAVPVLPREGEQQVVWAEAVQARALPGGVHEYTVAAEATGAGVVYVDVDVQRDDEGALQLAGYPAFVGTPLTAAAAAARGSEVDDTELVTVVDRALRNYLAGSAGDLAADLAPQARVSLPARPLALLAVQRVQWARRGGAVLAVVTAQDPRGAQYTLQYELDVEPLQGRWEIGAIQANEDA